MTLQSPDTITMEAARCQPAEYSRVVLCSGLKTLARSIVFLLHHHLEGLGYCTKPDLANTQLQAPILYALVIKLCLIIYQYDNSFINNRPGHVDKKEEIAVQIILQNIFNKDYQLISGFFWSIQNPKFFGEFKIQKIT